MIIGGGNSGRGITFADAKSTKKATQAKNKTNNIHTLTGVNTCFFI
jgi:hypothetical protein